MSYGIGFFLRFFSSVRLYIFLFALVLGAHSSWADEEVLVTIKPIHSLVQNIMGDELNATLLLDGGRSVHGLQLKPSHMRRLYKAKAIFYIDEKFETFLGKAFVSLPKGVGRHALAHSPGIVLRDLRQAQYGAWEKHKHGDHAGHDHHDHEAHAEHTGHTEHAIKDFHVWLDPLNAQKMIPVIVKVLSGLYPAKATIFQANGEALNETLIALDKKIKKQLANYQHKPYIVFHDGFQYFEKRYHLNAVGSLTLDPNMPVSVKRLMDIRKKIKTLNVSCIFHEPQFSTRLVNTALEGTSAHMAKLDPMGMKLKPGKTLYTQTLEAMAKAIESGLQ